MVKIENEYGDRYKGKAGNAIYQDQYGRQVRRKSYQQKKPPSKAQILTRQRFKEAIQTIKSLPYNQIQDIKKFYNILKEKDTRKYPVNWYNFAKWLYIKKPKLTIIDSLTNQYKIQHVNIARVEEKTQYLTTTYDSGKISDPTSGDFLKKYIKIPELDTALVEIYVLNDISHTIKIRKLSEDTQFFDIRFFDPRYFT